MRRWGGPTWQGACRECLLRYGDRAWGKRGVVPSFGSFRVTVNFAINCNAPMSMRGLVACVVRGFSVRCRSRTVEASRRHAHICRYVVERVLRVVTTVGRIRVSPSNGCIAVGGGKTGGVRGRSRRVNGHLRVVFEGGTRGHPTRR